MSLKNIWRRNILRRAYVHSRQRNFLERVGAGTNPRAILFIVPGYDRVNGGILSITSLAEETARLKDQHGADVFVCTIPGDPPLLRFTRFANHCEICDLAMLLSRLDDNSTVLMHIPEIFMERISNSIDSIASRFPAIAWQFNILLQNIDLIPRREHVEKLKGHGNITCTTAHEAYSNRETEKLIGCPVHHFSVWVSPEKYIRKNYAEKDNLIVVSPDKHLNRKEILDSLKSRLPNYEFKIIKNMTYEEYKRVIAQAKFSITFGEGLDGYFVESVFSGGIGATVFNSRFFTNELSCLPFVYQSWDELQLELPNDINSADEQINYLSIQTQQFTVFAMMYSHSNYIKNLKLYYQKFFTPYKKWIQDAP